MASKHLRWGPIKVVSNFITGDGEVADMGAFRVVGAQVRRLKTQSTQQFLKLQHNSTKDADGWLDTGAQWDLNTTTNDFVEVTSFSRYLRLLAPQGADGSAVVVADLIGKE